MSGCAHTRSAAQPASPRAGMHSWWQVRCAMERAGVRRLKPAIAPSGADSAMDERAALRCVRAHEHACVHARVCVRVCVRAFILVGSGSSQVLLTFVSCFVSISDAATVSALTVWSANDAVLPATDAAVT